jgi:hypothetical protein
MERVMSDLFEFAQAKAERDTGIQQAIDHADAEQPGWSTEAYSFLLSYARKHKTFISEQCTDAALLAGVPPPPDLRAWGHPFRRAAKAGVIVRAGFGISARRHLSPTPLWESKICQ